jgi:ribosome-associated protein
MAQNEKTETINLAESENLARAITAILIEKKALEVKMYNVTGKSPICDFYINATGRSSTQVHSLCDEVTYKICEMGRQEGRIEGRGGDSWLLVDYGDVIVNVFDRQSREFYNLDRILPADSLVDISDIIEEIDKKYEINTIKED